MASRRYFNVSDLKLFTLSDLIGRTVEVRQFKDCTNNDATVIAAYDISNGEIFILAVEWATRATISEAESENVRAL